MEMSWVPQETVCQLLTAEEIKAKASEDSMEKIEISNGHRWQAASEMPLSDPTSWYVCPV